MLNRLIREKRYFLGLVAILFLYLIITLIIWEKLPDKIYIPLRWNGHRDVGFYEKNIQNVVYVFMTPLLGGVLIKLASMLAFGQRKDIFSIAISQSLDLLCYLFVIMGPAAFLVCTFLKSSSLSYIFYPIGVLILFLNFKSKGYR